MSDWSTTACSAGSSSANSPESRRQLVPPRSQIPAHGVHPRGPGRRTHSIRSHPPARRSILATVDPKRQHDTTIAAGTIDAGNVAVQRITISGIRADRPLIRFRAAWFCTTDLDPAWEVRETGWHVSLDGDAPLEVTLRMAVPLDRMAAVSPAYTAPTERSTRCHMSAQPPRASSPRWTFLRSSPRWDEKQTLLDRELKLPEMRLLLTAAPGRCQSYETNSSHLSYATLIHREATS